MSNIAFIVNPKAGKGLSSWAWNDFKVIARERLGHFLFNLTTGVGDAKRLTEGAIKKGATLIVCVGGDGTLNEVINGIMEQDIAVRNKIVLGYVPMGTGCDFIKTVRIPKNPFYALDSIYFMDNIKKIDVGRLSFKDNDGNDCYRHFNNITSFGLGGEVNRRVNNSTKRFGPFLSFIWATLVSIFRYGGKEVYLKVDLGPTRKFTVLNIAVANGKYHGGGMCVAPNALTDDGLFNVTVIENLSPLKVLLNLPKLYNGKIKDVDGVVTLTGKRIEASSEQKVLLDVDGEQPGTLPVTIDVIPSAINIITM
jgi:YegS/Rv2252/BmrU family lipid kinase